MKRKATRNKVLIVVVILGFIAVAGWFIHAQDLTEYEGTLEENISFDLPAGYELQGSGDNPDAKRYVRETANTKETINIYYEGLGRSNGYDMGDAISIDDSTDVEIERFDVGHDQYNALDCMIRHGEEYYHLEYKCQETDKHNYYSSCSKAQEDEIVGFIKTFDFHRPDGSDMNALQRLYHNFGIGGCVVLVLAILFFIGIPVAIGISGLTSDDGKEDDADAVISSRDLHEAMNRERKVRGESDIPSINTVQGTSTSNLARRDHSWSSVPDFFVKLFRKSK